MSGRPHRLVGTESGNAKDGMDLLTTEIMAGTRRNLQRDRFAGLSFRTSTEAYLRNLEGLFDGIEGLRACEGVRRL